jgi:hypothetical protein
MPTALAIKSLEVEAPKVRASEFEIPLLPALDRVPRRIDADQERELRAYLAEPHVASIRGSSGFGGQLERAAMLGYGPVPCRRCGGTWSAVRRKNGKESITDWREGTGLAPRDRFGKRRTYAVALAAYRREQAQRLNVVITSKPSPTANSGVDAENAWAGVIEAYRAQGQVAMTEQELRELFPELPEHDPVTGKPLCHPCGACEGLGVIPRRAPKKHDAITCFPKGSSVQGGSADSDSRVSIFGADTYLAMAITLKDVANVSPLARLALEGYYRPQRKGLPSGWEALHELLPVTNDPSSVKGSEDARKRQAREAAALYDHACRAYNYITLGPDARERGRPDFYDGLGDDHEECESGHHRIDAAAYLRITAPEVP